MIDGRGDPSRPAEIGEEKAGRPEVKRRDDFDLGILCAVYIWSGSRSSGGGCSLDLMIVGVKAVYDSGEAALRPHPAWEWGAVARPTPPGL